METKHIKAAEKVLNNFLKAWQDKRPAEMVKYCPKTWAETHRDQDAIKYLESLICRAIDNYRIQPHNKIIGESCIDLHVSMRIANGVAKVYRFRLICETAPYTPSLDGDWGVNPISMRLA